TKRKHSAILLPSLPQFPFVRHRPRRFSLHRAQPFSFQMGSGKPYSGRWQFCALFGLAAVCLGLPLFWNTTTNELSTESCTGPGIGHTIGDNGEVLRFTHVDGDSTSLPALLRSVWDAKAAEGVFRFSVKDLPTRHAEGPRLGWAVELLAIVGRRKPFPDPLPTY
ncbi:unnamed protein product, partial [Phaeothamnion confervicola]